MAEKLENQVFYARKRILGVEHPDTTKSMANLACTYNWMGKYREAEKLEIQALDAQKRILGVEHPDTINSMANLACTYTLMGKCTEAEKLQNQVLDARKIILGVEHPDTILSMGNIARTYCPISFNSNRGVTCDHLFEILVSNTSQKEGDRVQPDTCPPPN